MSLGIQPQKPKRRKLHLRGGNAQGFAHEGHECIVSGPSQTGKTVAMCMKMHKICNDVPKTQCLVVRKVYKAMRDTVLRTYANTAVGCGVRAMGGETPSLFIYPNASKLIPIGMDNLGNVLSGEYGAIYVNQAEELSEAEWETLGSRCTGRGTDYPHPQIFGDCNPGGSKHWIRTRAKAGKLTLFNTDHRDNPQLYDTAGKLTSEGEKQMSRLEGVLSGVRRERLLYGKWVTAEGCVYANFDPRWHVCTANESALSRWFLACDDGFTNPAVVLLVGEDPDGRWHVLREFYQTGQSREVVVKQAREWSKEKRCELAAVDAAAPELIEQMKAVGVMARPAKGRLQDTIPLVRDALEMVKSDKSSRWPEGRPRLTIDPSCVETANELESYVYKPGTDTPVKEHDHAMDALRYLKIAVTVGGAKAVTVTREAVASDKIGAASGRGMII